MRISRNFTLEELTHSDIALEYNIDNTPSKWNISNLKELVLNVLQPIRNYIDKPVIISSGYRGEKLNSHPKIRGAKNSSHKYGYAADIQVDNIEDVFKWIVDNLEYTQAIIEKKGNTEWIHISYNKNKLTKNTLRYKDGEYSGYEGIVK